MVMVFPLILGLASFSALALQPRLFVLGRGHVGKAVMNEAAACGAFDLERIQATSRAPSDDRTVLFDPHTIRSTLSNCTHVLITIPPPRDEDSVFDAVAYEVESHLPRGSWLGFVSTSGVYGDHGGAWVTEDSPLYCSEESLTYRYILHENQWKKHAEKNGWTFRVFRCAGLYGHTRSALHTLWKEKVLQLSSTPGITNRIHETDVARAIVASMVLPSAQKEDFRIYNLADDEPESRNVVMKYAAQLFESIGIQVTKKKEKSDDSTRPSSRAIRRGVETKLLSNQRVKDDLVMDLVYPTYREGLSTILNDRSNPWWNEVEVYDDILC